MIHVERDAIDEAGERIRPSDTWFELAAAATARTMIEKANHEADRAIYAHAEVKKALERLFHDKCAYCESKITATADWDVEHFRPKASVDAGEEHQGYYWLTYEWTNLYPSCQHCNQRRMDRPRWEDPVGLPAGGKASQFPLVDESTRVMGSEGDVSSEDTLLIDPCYDDPEEYLGYDPTGQIFSLNDNPYGTVTIDVLHLSRRRLSDLRRETIQLVIGVLKLIAQANADLASDLQDFLAKIQADDRQHAGVARYVGSRPAEFGVGV